MEEDNYGQLELEDVVEKEQEKSLENLTNEIDDVNLEERNESKPEVIEEPVVVNTVQESKDIVVINQELVIPKAEMQEATRKIPLDNNINANKDKELSEFKKIALFIILILIFEIGVLLILSI